MRMRAIVWGLIVGLAAGATVVAQEPVVGVKDPESLFKDANPKLNRNKQATLHIMRELLQCGQWDRAGEWLGCTGNQCAQRRSLTARSTTCSGLQT